MAPNPQIIRLNPSGSDAIDTAYTHAIARRARSVNQVALRAIVGHAQATANQATMIVSIKRLQRAPAPRIALTRSPSRHRRSGLAAAEPTRAADQDFFCQRMQ